MNTGKSRIGTTRLRISTITSSHTSMTGRGRFSHCLDDFREKSERYNSLAELHNFILAHQHDRKVSVTVWMISGKSRIGTTRLRISTITSCNTSMIGAFQSLFG